jgi:PPM family protein phosphatase
MLYAAKSHIGLVRQMNQDGYAVLSDLSPSQFYVVADGMGGPSAGEVASSIAVDAVTEFVKSGITRADLEPADLVRKAIYHANQKIFSCAKEKEEYFGMGTTIVCALASTSNVLFAHVGDSRGYVYKQEKLTQVTKDHSLVAELVRRGQLTEDEALHHPRRNIVTRSLGTDEDSYPDLYSVDWAPGDAVLLCSDGLTNLVYFDELQSFMRKMTQATTGRELEMIADAMVRLALERGGPDNITLILVLYREEGQIA